MGEQVRQAREAEAEPHPNPNPRPNQVSLNPRPNQVSLNPRPNQVSLAQKLDEAGVAPLMLVAPHPTRLVPRDRANGRRRSRAHHAGRNVSCLASQALRDAVCAMAAALTTTVVINPVDVVRVRLYSQPILEDGRGALYRGGLDCFAKVAATESPAALWKGVSAAFLRIGPHQTLTFVIIGWLQRQLGGGLEG